jgi:type IV secretory pathway VirB2 component (pilin)
MAAIANTALLTSVGVPVEAWLIRTRQLVEGAFGTVQAKLPLFVVEATIAAYVAPPSVEYSIFTFPTVPVVVQVRVCDDPAVQLSPPLGDVTVSVAGMAAIMNAVLLISEGVPVEAWLIRIRQLVEGAFGTVQA